MKEERKEPNPSTPPDEPIVRLNSSLTRALEQQRRTIEEISRVNVSGLTRQFASIQNAAFATRMNRTIGNASFTRSIQEVQRTLGAQSSMLNNRLLRGAGLNFASKMQSETLRALRANTNSVAVSIGAATRALNSAGLSQSIAEALTPAFTNRVGSIMERFARDFEQLSQRIREQAERDIRFSQLMIEIGWPPPADLPLSLVNQILRLADEKGAEAATPHIEKVLCDFYTPERLQRKVRKWGRTKLLGRRKRILEKAIKAHAAGDYELSVPTVVAQVEGVIADGFGHVGRMNGKQYQDYLNAHFDSDGDSRIEDAANQAVQSFVAKVLLAQFEHGSPSRSKLSRHAILHGGDTDYPSEENSLKAILLLDVLQDSFGFVTIEGSSVFHKDGCPAVLNSKRRARHHKDADALLDGGKRPCKRCNPL